MAKVVIIGAGFAGQTAALYLGKALGRDHEVTMISANADFYYIPSFVWVGIGRMAPERTCFPLQPVYNRFHVRLVHGWAKAIDPQANYVLVEPRAGDGGDDVRVDYDYLLIATGPKLNFAGTPGLGPKEGRTWSICTQGHAIECRDRYLEAVARMEKGEKQKLVIGTGHPAATCQGAAFEYITNIHKDLIRRQIRDRASLHWFTNERALGDFGIRGLCVKTPRGRLRSEDFIKAVFDDFQITWEAQRGATGIADGRIVWEDFKGEQGETAFDFAMLIPQFTGVRMDVLGEDRESNANQLFNPAGFVSVDAQYGLDWSALSDSPEAWPSVYQNPTFRNVFAAGIAFAPPGPISQPHTNPNGLSITAAPPRTGMVSGVIGRVVAKNIIDLVKRGRMTHQERMTEMAAACIASMGDSLWDGSAATIMIYPVVPNSRRYPNEEGRDSFVTHMEMGLAGAWMKRLIHTTFMHKLRGRVGWQLIPE